MLKNVNKILLDNLNNNLIPFWNSLKDRNFGGFYGDSENQLAPKGSIYLSRLLWSYAKLYQFKKEAIYLENASYIFNFLNVYVFDKENGGIYWSVNYDGTPHIADKHLYAHAFCLYGLSEYYHITEDVRVLKRIEQLIDIIDRNLIDFPNNYFEQYTVDWQKKENSLLEGHGLIPEITTNTLLHLAEATGTAYSVLKLTRYKQITENLIDIIFKVGYDFENHNLYQFLDYQFNDVFKMISYGHNIEVSWLFTKIIKDCGIDRPNILNELKLLGIKSMEGFNGKYLNNELIGDNLDRSLIWWVQAEALIGLKYLVNAGETAYLKDIETICMTIKDRLMTSDEWHWGFDNNDKLMENHHKAEMWKSSYHNVRAILEVVGEDRG